MTGILSSLFKPRRDPDSELVIPQFPLFPNFPSKTAVASILWTCFLSRPPLKGDCSADAGVKMGLKAPAKCKVSLTCLPAALFFGLVLTKTVILWTLYNAKLDLNPSLGINLFLT